MGYIAKPSKQPNPVLYGYTDGLLEQQVEIQGMMVAQKENCPALRQILQSVALAPHRRQCVSLGAVWAKSPHRSAIDSVTVQLQLVKSIQGAAPEADLAY